MQQVIGHNQIRSDLKKAIQNGSLSHAYFFYGPKGVGKFTTALEIGQNLLCERRNACGECQSCRFSKTLSHPDLLVLNGEDTIKIEETRKIKEFLSLTPFQADLKIVLIKDITRLTREAGNSLLKILEEPQGKTLFILTAIHPSSTLQTLVSRCQLQAFKTLAENEIVEWLKRGGVVGENALKIAKISAGKPGLATNYLDQTEEDSIKNIFSKSLQQKFDFVSQISSDGNLKAQLDQLILWFRDVLLVKYGNQKNTVNLKDIDKLNECAVKMDFKTIKKVFNLAENLSDLPRGANARLLLENLILNAEV